MPVKGLLERLNAGEVVIGAEGYLFEFEARGYLKAGGYVPEVVLEHPEKVRDLYREFVHAGSDVVLAFTYYAHREKMRLIGRENELEKINRTALKIAREVANETGTLMAGNISNSTVYKDDPQVIKELYANIEEQVKWAVEAGGDFILVETIDTYAESSLALKACKEFGKGLPVVVMLVLPSHGKLEDGYELVEAMQKLEAEGADVIGLNCGRGPTTMLDAMKEVVGKIKVPLAALPVTYRTDKEHKNFQALTDVDDKDRPVFPVDLDCQLCSRKQIADFTKQAYDMGIRYMGLCCGNRAHYTRTMAETLGRRPPASRYSPDMSQHYSRIKDDRHNFTQATFEKQYVIRD